MDVYCCNGVGFRRFVFEVEVGLTKKMPSSYIKQEGVFNLRDKNFSGI